MCEICPAGIKLLENKSHGPYLLGRNFPWTVSISAIKFILIEILVHPSDTHISEVVLLLKQKLCYGWNKGLKMVLSSI